MLPRHDFFLFLVSSVSDIKGDEVIVFLAKTHPYNALNLNCIELKTTDSWPRDEIPNQIIINNNKFDETKTNNRKQMIVVY